MAPHMHEEYPFPAGIFQTGSQAPPMSWVPQKRWSGLYPVARTGAEKRLHCPVEAVVPSVSSFHFSALSTINYRASCVFSAAAPQACSNIQSMGVRHAGRTGSPPAWSARFISKGLIYFSMPWLHFRGRTSSPSCTVALEPHSLMRITGQF